MGERALRSNEANSASGRLTATTAMSLPEIRKRRQLTEQELEARRKKVIT